MMLSKVRGCAYILWHPNQRQSFSFELEKLDSKAQESNTLLNWRKKRKKFCANLVFVDVSMPQRRLSLESNFLSFLDRKAFRSNRIKQIVGKNLKTERNKPLNPCFSSIENRTVFKLRKNRKPWPNRFSKSLETLNIIFHVFAAAIWYIANLYNLVQFSIYLIFFDVCR